MFDAIGSKLEGLVKEQKAEAARLEEEKILASAKEVEESEPLTSQPKEEPEKADASSSEDDDKPIEMNSQTLGQVPVEEEEETDEERFSKLISQDKFSLQRRKAMALSQISSLPLPGESHEQH
mmetsp:Transcript_34424/g.52711  ORF Transcript_34424/g.52711 Transcript_34424/m.52711 type:complete len:123 (+) Transcript_34424:1609-1977(+)